MFTWIRKAAFVALLMTVPLQALAATIAPFMCVELGDHHSSQTTTHSHDGYGAAVAREHEDSAGDAVNHFECHHVFSAVPVKAQPATPADPPVFRAIVSLMATLHFPESPQRPPKA